MLQFPLHRNWRFSAILQNWHGSCKALGKPGETGSTAGSGSKTMTTTNAKSLGQTLASLIAALVLSTVTLTATTGTGPASTFQSAGSTIA
jgi:hypothetical protein